MASTSYNSIQRAGFSADASSLARKKETQFDFLISSIAVILICMASVVWAERVAHWFLIPSALCGALCGVEISRWLRGRLEIFDPLALSACLMFYGFFIAPILHVAFDRYGAGYDFIIHGDFRDWLGLWGALNVVGLIGFRILQRMGYRHSAPIKSHWTVDNRIATPILLIAWIIGLCGLAYLLALLGGISGMISSFETSQEDFTGKGWLLVLAWPLSILSLIAFDILTTAKVHKKNRFLARTVMGALVFGIGHVMALGWFGSRSSTVWAIFWMAGILHYKHRKLKPRLVLVGMFFLMAFMYFYGFYKEKGTASLEVVTTPSQWLNPKGYNRDLQGLLLGDLARADTASYILYCIVDPNSDYDYRWGLTYVSAFTLLIPRNLWPDRPHFKVEAGTEAQHGKTGRLSSSRVYGLTGEGLLNFGVLGIPLAFAAYGFSMGWYRHKLHTVQPTDSRLYLAPFLSIMFASMLIGDADNVFFGALTEGAYVSFVIFLISIRTRSGEMRARA